MVNCARWAQSKDVWTVCIVDIDVQTSAPPVTRVCFLDIDGSQLLYARNEGNFDRVNVQK